MKKTVTLFLVLILIVGGLQAGVALAKGGKGGSGGPGGSSGSSISSGQKGSFGDSAKDKVNVGEESQKKQEQNGSELYRESMAALDKEMVASGVAERFRNRLMEQLRTRLEEECREVEKQGGEIGRVESRGMIEIVCQAEQEGFSPEETASICAAFQGSVWAGISSRFGEALSTEGIRRRQPAAQIENALRLVTRFRREFRCPMLSSASQEDEESLAELGRKMAALCQQERLEERLRKSLQLGCSLEEAVDQLLIY